MILVSLHLFTVLADLSTVPADLTYLLTSTFPIALPSVCLVSARYLQLHIRSFSLGLSRFSRPVAHLLVIYCRKRIVRTAHDCIMSAPHNRPSTMILQAFIDSLRNFYSTDFLRCSQKNCAESFLQFPTLHFSNPSPQHSSCTCA